MWMLPALLGFAQIAFWPVRPLITGDPAPPGAAAGVIAGTLIAVVGLGLRRDRPVPALILVTAGITVATLTTPEWQVLLVPGDASVLIAVADLIALFSVAVRSPARTTLIATGAVAVWQTVLTWEGPAGAVVMTGGYAIVAAFGRVRRRWNADRAGAARRLAEAERAHREAADAERRRLARELHDVTAHHLTSVVVNLQAAGMLGDQRPELRRQALDFAARTGRETLDALRRLVAIMPLGTTVDAPAPSLAELADDFRTLGQEVTLRLPAGEPPGDIAEAMHGIAREALTNTLRYAPGGSVTLLFRYVDSGAELIVEDRGAAAGITGATGLGGGRGVTGMRERAAALGGTLTAGPFSDRASFSDRAQFSDRVSLFSRGSGSVGDPEVGSVGGPGVGSGGGPGADAGPGAGSGGGPGVGSGGGPGAGAGPAEGWRVRALVPRSVPGAAGRRLRRWAGSRIVLDSGLILLVLALPLSAMASEDIGVPALVAVAAATAAHAVPLWWRRRHPWPVLGAVLATAWLGPLLCVAGLVPAGAGWLFLFGVGAELVAVHAAGSWAGRPARTWLAPAATVSSVLALATLVAVDPDTGAGAEPVAGPVAVVLTMMIFTILFGVLLVPPAFGSWWAGMAVRARRERRRAREEGGVAAVVAGAEARTLAERIRIADGLRADVLRHAEALPVAAERGDLDEVLGEARRALSAMRSLLDGMSHTDLDRGSHTDLDGMSHTDEEAPSSPSVS
jgi:signal transduction histidine kinase